jgi:hypothetical protein
MNWRNLGIKSVLTDGEKYKNCRTRSMTGKRSVKESTLHTSVCVCARVCHICVRHCACAGWQHVRMENKHLSQDSVALHHKFILVSYLIFCN